MRLPVAALVALAALGCREPEPAAPPPAPLPPPAAAAPTAEDPGYLVALDAEGLRLVQQPSGSTRLIAFGSAAEEAVAALASAWGPEAGRDELPDCGAKPPTLLRWPNGVTAHLAQGQFRGWGASAPRAPRPGERLVTSMAGLGIGSTRAEAASAAVLETQETTLGTEFSAGGIYGVLDGAGPDARVTSLWAGETCIFR